MKLPCHIISLSLAVLLYSCSGTEYTGQTETILDDLDKVIENRKEIERTKEDRISDIRGRMHPAMSPQERYGVYDNLYEEYQKYRLDSAIAYAHEKEKLAQTIGEDYFICDAKLDLADRYVLSGMYSEALASAGSLDMQTVCSTGLLPRMLHIYHSLYTGLAETCDDPLLAKKYAGQKRHYREQLLNTLGEDDIARKYVLSEIYIENRDWTRAAATLDECSALINDNIHDMAVVNYLRAEIATGTGRRDEAIRYYALSSISDLSTPIKEYKSLYGLASLMYDDGHIKRAFKYITRSIDDANSAKAKLNIQSINDLLPVISASYDKQMRAKNRIISTALGVISFFGVLLALLLFSLTREKRRIKMTNLRLQKYIARLAEANNIKEAYIGRYLDQCSEYIGHIEEYRSQLRKTAKEAGMEGIHKELRSTKFIDSELQDFYRKFDSTFLDLFPDFISNLNALLREDKRIDIKENEKALTTELRICALIRLGVNDSADIARFLRRSVSTIYNYRVKMRNSALNDRDNFEKEIMKIGRNF